MGKRRMTIGRGRHQAACVLILFLAHAGAAWAQSPGTPNRSLPRVEPPKTLLQFSARPTATEIFRARVFEEPLVPIGGDPGTEENAALASALLRYANRRGPDDFSALTGFLQKYPRSPWCAALLTDLGLEYYNTAHYSLAIDAWEKAWSLAKEANDAKGRAIAGRAVGELAYMYARLGRMSELEILLKSVEGRSFSGPASGKLTGAREGWWSMQNRPEVSFRCGPLALRCIQVSLDSKSTLPAEIVNSASTQRGFSLPQVAKLSKEVGLNYQMAFREKNGAFVVPSVVHWKVGHYAAMVRREGNLYLLQDPTFGNEIWATVEALEAETSGYFLIPPGPLPNGWRVVDEKEGGEVWGKGQTSSNDGRNIARNDLATRGGVCRGMAVPSVHLMTVNLHLDDEPLGYTPPVGPAVRLRMGYNHRDSFQPANFNYWNFGPKWTCDWLSYVTDNPSNTLADVKLYPPGGGERLFTGFATNSQSASQQYDETILKRNGPGSYELTFGDGSKLVFAQPDGSIGSSRKIFMTQMVDPAGNTVTLTYDGNLRLVALTDAIGQVTTLTYGLTNDIFKVTQVTDPFGRFATFNYQVVDIAWSYVLHNDCPNPSVVATPTQDIWLRAITDVIGLSSQFSYLVVTNPTPACAGCLTNGASACRLDSTSVDFIVSLTTPYGKTSFVNQDSGNTRVMEITYPDASRERVEFNQAYPIPNSDPVAEVPHGLVTKNDFLGARNTFYWSRTACALGYRDISKARLYHWLHTESLSATSGALESVKQPLERRVWYDYPGQNLGGGVISANVRPAHVARVLDDGSTQLSSFAFNSLGRITNAVDPLGRTVSFVYAANGVDLLEARQKRGGNNDLLLKLTYNAQHRPLTMTDASGQTGVFTYNSRGQILTRTNPRGETDTYTYDTNGYLLTIDGPLPGTNDTATFTYDAYGRVRTRTDLNGYVLTFDYDDMDRNTRVTYPDFSFNQFVYDRLDLSAVSDRAGRLTSMEYDRMRQMIKRTDPIGRTTFFEWCSCGSLKSLTDAMGRTTTWTKDAQGRTISKQFGDGSQVQYVYENTTSRLRKRIDEKQQATLCQYNRDNSLKSISYANSAVATAPISFVYDPDYERVVSMTDGTGTTLYSYNPITGTPTLGAGALVSVDGPLANDTITYSYDELGRQVSTAIDGVGTLNYYDAAGRLIAQTNALGYFNYTYDGSSRRLLSSSSPNGLTATATYGDNVNDRLLQQISHTVGATPISQFVYDYDLRRARISTWSQQASLQAPSVFTFGYDAVNQLFSASVTNSGVLVNNFAYSYDPAGNRLMEQIGSSNYTATYNALNQINTTTAPAASRTNEWDALNRLTAVNRGNQRTEFTYDGGSRLVKIRQLINGSEVSQRRFVWCGGQICEERDASGANVTKRFFSQGVKVEAGPSTGAYYYTRDHLGSVRELTDGAGNVRARYTYDPFGRRTRIGGDVDADFGFAGMFWASEVSLALTHFRAYDPELGRWLSRDPLTSAEVRQGPNLYAYVGNEPVNRADPAGLCTGSTLCACVANPANAAACAEAGVVVEKTVESPAGQRALQAGQQVLQAGEQVVESCGAAIESLPARLPSLQNAVAQAPAVRNAIQSLPTAQSYPVDPFAETAVAETLPDVTGVMPNGAYSMDWLRSALNAKDLLPGYDLLPPEHTVEITRAIVEKSDMIEDALNARDEIQFYLDMMHF